MLSVFPDLYNYANLVPDILRLFLGLFLFKTAWVEYISTRSNLAPKSFIFWSILDLIAGVFILAGFLIQPTALVYTIFIILMILFRNKIPLAKNYSFEFLILLAIAFLSLAILGPGLFAIDLPL